MVSRNLNIDDFSWVSNATVPPEFQSQDLALAVAGHETGTPNNTVIFLITPTYERNSRLTDLVTLLSLAHHSPNVIIVFIEDGPLSPTLLNYLQPLDWLQFVYVANIRTKKKTKA